MAAIGSLVFCTDCGSLLDANTGGKAQIACELCGKSNKDSSSKVVVTSSKPSAFPSTLRTQLRSDVQEISESEMNTDALIQQTCDKCGCLEMRFYTLQLRGADEGTTIFYTCPKCGHKWNENN